MIPDHLTESYLDPDFQLNIELQLRNGSTEAIIEVLHLLYEAAPCRTKARIQYMLNRRED